MKKKILFIIWSFTAGGGAEKILANVVNNLDKNKYDISILEFINCDIKKEHIESHIKVLKPILRKNKYKGLKYLLYEIYSSIIKLIIYKFPNIIRKIFIRESYDIEISFNYFIPSFLVAAKKYGKKICWVHSSIENLDYSNCNNYIKSAIIKKSNIMQLKAFKKIDDIIAISEKTENSIKEIYPQMGYKVKRIYNGYEFDKIIKLSNQYIDKVDKSAPYILAIGRLVEQKNFLLLIDVAEKLHKKGIDFKMDIIGDGYQFKLLNDYIEYKGVGKKVQLLGYKNNPYVYLKKADIFCLTSIAEGFPTVLIEAMTLGCPFISTNVAGADELSNEGKCGIVVEESDANIISDNIIKLTLNRDKLKKMSIECIKHSRNYSLEKQIKKIEYLLDEEV